MKRPFLFIFSGNNFVRRGEEHVRGTRLMVVDCCSTKDWCLSMLVSFSSPPSPVYFFIFCSVCQGKQGIYVLAVDSVVNTTTQPHNTGCVSVIFVFAFILWAGEV